MTAAITGLNISIGPGMDVQVTAADWDAEGHLWAIEARPLTIEQLRAIAAIIGPDATSGVESRLLGELRRAVEKSRVADVRLAEANAAAVLAEQLEAHVNKPGTPS